MQTLSFALSGILASALFHSPLPGPAPQGRIRELVCRGAPDIDLRFDKDPSPLNPRMIRFVLRYKPGQQPVGTEYENLAPGACTWNRFNLPDMPVEPGTLWFDAEREFLGGGPLPDTSIKAAELYPDRTTIPRYLKESSHYWKFYVDDVSHLSISHWAAKYYPREAVVAPRTVVVDSGGPAGKSTDRAGTSTLGTGSLRDASPTLDAARVPLTFHEVVRKPTQYWLRFGARAKSSPTVQYGIAPPIRKDGRLTFYQPFPWTVRVQSENGFAGEYSTAPLRGLVQGKKYYFVINVPAGERGIPAQEYSGEFWALAQHITVRFTRIDVLNDSDKIDSGEITFQYHLAPGDKNNYTCSAPEVCYVRHSAVSWESGSKNPIDVTLSQKITTPWIRIWVAGKDSDNFVTHNEWGNVRWTKYYGRSTNMYDDNNARAQLNMVPVVDQMTYSIAFKLRSFDGAVLMYEVHGQAESAWK
jgi:hypothetical protein